MKFVLYLFLWILSLTSFAQLREGFKPEEAKNLIALCNSYTFLDLYNSDSLIIPKVYNKIYTSDVIGLDNMFQVYENGKIGILNFRGSTTKTSSWMENIFSAMIPAKGIIKINNDTYNYKFANDTSAAVHSGYALATVLLAHEVIKQIDKLNSKGIFNILITGHSQGGALAHMMYAYLENLSKTEISNSNKFKTYSFANPMCGNKEFAIEYQEKYESKNLSFSIINPKDPIPKLPTHFPESATNISKEKAAKWIVGKEEITFKEVMEPVFKRMQPVLENYIYSSNMLIEKFISFSYIKIDLPKYIKDVNYFQVGKIIELEPFNLSSSDRNTIKTQSYNSDFENDSTNKKSLSQHKPYNYYVAILKEYFPKEYEELEHLQLSPSTIKPKY